MDFKNDPKEQERLSFIKSLNAKSQEEEAKKLAESLNLPYIFLPQTPIEILALEEVSKQVAQKTKSICFDKKGKILKIAFVKESEDFNTLKQDLTNKGFELKLYICSLYSFEHAFKKYDLVPEKRTPITGEINIQDAKYVPFNDLSSFDLSNLTTSFVLNTIFKSAIKAKASDIHINPQKEACSIKFRIDGLLYNILELNKEEYVQIRNRLKLLAKLKVNILTTPQDGRFTIIDDLNYEVRLSSIPGNNGEILVMRILDPNKIGLTLNDLGISDYELKLINLVINSTNGGILVTGPTGSGKTTTLYAMLKQKLNKGLNITTIEDPIEYKIKEINQTQINEKQGYDFAGGLRSIVRQDPDVILVGEIRDRDTASIASQAALTGHLLLSTLHTNEACATIMRLKELGVQLDTISSFLKIVIAQRLCRKLCPHCMEKYVPTEEVKEKLKSILSILSYKTGINVPSDIKYLYRSKGCEKCNNLGYKGQTGLFEIMFLNDVIKESIRNNEPLEDLRKLSIEEGMIPLIHTGILKAIEGQTSLEEVYRVCGDISYAEELYQSLLADKLDNKLIIDDDLYSNIFESLSNFDIVQDLITKSTTKIIFQIINICGLLYNASDVHIEPTEEKVIVRYRIDGMLTDKLTLPKEEYISFVAYLKELMDLKTDAGNIKEGRYTIEKENKTDVRVSIIPSGYGETIVLRFLKNNLNLDLNTLGLSTENIEKIYTAKNNPSGIILSCGPTSSGKTTTIYSILKLLNDKSKKILTIEDPIEYTLDNVIQTQVDKNKDYTFSNALKGFLRQNPDIILVGEIRDKETAQVAVQASLTGHLILSTLHTIDISSSLLRMQNFDINKEELLNSINCLISQRLCRKLCPHCMKKIQLNDFQKEKLASFNIKTPEYIYEAVGCKECSFTGYKGQIGLFEVLTLNDQIRKSLLSSLENKNFKETVYSLTDSLIKDGLNKLVEGKIDVKELERVLGNKIF